MRLHGLADLTRERDRAHVGPGERVDLERNAPSALSASTVTTISATACSPNATARRARLAKRDMPR